MTMDSLGLSSMKNAVNCDKYCLLQTPKWTIKILNAYCSFDLNQNWSWRRVYMSIKPHIYMIIQHSHPLLKVLRNEVDCHDTKFFILIKRNWAIIILGVLITRLVKTINLLWDRQRTEFKHIAKCRKRNQQGFH